MINNSIKKKKFNALVSLDDISVESEFLDQKKYFEKLL